MALNIANTVRQEFPAVVGNPGRDYIFADAPTGTQIHQSVIDAMCSYMQKPGAHLFGTHPGGLNTIGTVQTGRQHCAAFFNCLPEETVFGPNSTTLVFHIARSLGSHFKELWHKEKSSKAGDDLGPAGPWQMPILKYNLVVTNLEHDTNVSPFVRMAEDLQDIMEVRRVNIDTQDCTLPLSEIEKAIDNRTVMVAIGAASNACGTINPIKEISKIIKQASFASGKSNGIDRCLFFVDAVHHAPHHVLDVQELGCDFCVCSPFKFFGPHTGLLFGKSDLLRGLRPYKLKACTEELPGQITQMSRWETGTINFEGIAGITAVIKYIASLGTRFGEAQENDTLRDRIVAGYKSIHEQESKLTEVFLNRVASIPGLKIYGNNDPNSCRSFLRTPTFAVRLNGHPKYSNAFELADGLQQGYNIVSQAGSFYAIYLIESLGLKDEGGVVRIGFTHYNTIEEIEKVTKALEELARF